MTVLANHTVSPQAGPSASLLDDLKAQPVWLLWRSEPDPDPIKKPRKVPWYVNGGRREGVLDSPEDRDKLVTFAEAIAKHGALAGTFEGLAIALGPDGRGGCWQGIDLDNIEQNSLAGIANQWVREDCAGWGYVEVSPSGTGAHVIGYGREFHALGSNSTGIEAYCRGRFFTFTGKSALNESPCRAVDLSGYVEQVLAPRHSATRPLAANDGEGLRIDPKTVTELRSALLHMRSDDRSIWIAIGHALKELGDTGRGLWMDWSATSDKFDPKDAASKWETFTPRHTGYQAVFKMAQERAWVNPASTAAQAVPPATACEADATAPDNASGADLLCRLSVDWTDETDAEVPDIIEGLVADEDVTLLGGHGGIGKSFLSLQAACAVATGEPVLYRETRRCRVLYYSAEDGRKRLTRRLRNLVAHAGFDEAALKRNLRVLDASEVEPLYGETVEQADGKRPVFTKMLGPRADFTNLQKMVEEFDPQLVIIDGASDTFDGNEIARREVRAFVKLLRRVHPGRKIGVLLNVHIDRSSARGHSSNDDGYAGSAQWHNSCRRRLFLQQEVRREYDEDTKQASMVAGDIVLRVMKNQDGPPEPDTVLERGLHGLWQIATDTSGITAAQQDETDHGPTLLGLVSDYYERGIYMSTSLAPQATTGVYASLRDDPQFPRGLNRKRTEAVVRQLERDGLLTKEDYTRGNRAKGERWTVARGPDDAN